MRRFVRAVLFVVALVTGAIFTCAMAGWAIERVAYTIEQSQLTTGAKQ